MNENRVLIVSDTHLGAIESSHIGESMRATSNLIPNLIGSCREDFSVVINGDLIAGPFQRGGINHPRSHEYPTNWEEILSVESKPLFDVLRDTQVPVTYLMGNCERRNDMTMKVLDRRFGTNINWTQQTGQHATWMPEGKQLITHMDLAEPEMSILKRSAVFELLPEPLRNALYRRYGAALNERMAVAGGYIEMAADTSHIQAKVDLVDAEAERIDDVHKISCDANNRIEKILSWMPPLKKILSTMKDRHVLHTLQQVYLRIAAQMPFNNIAPKSISFGHIHQPFIYNRQQLQEMLGVEPSPGLEFAANSGTGVPLTAQHGGSDQSHVLFWRGNTPELYRTYDRNDPTAAPRLIN